MAKKKEEKKKISVRLVSMTHVVDVVDVVDVTSVASMQQSCLCLRTANQPCFYYYR